MKPLKPTMREKARYLAFELKIEDNQGNLIPPKPFIEYQNALIEELEKNLGVFLSANAGIKPVKYDSELGRGILRTTHRSIDDIKACFPLIKEVKGKEVSIRSVGVSGMLNKATTKYFDERKLELQQHVENIMK